eukprot:COSAG02_NODE_1170_length_14123_cov_9.614946_10_plen_761_part_00
MSDLPVHALVDATNTSSISEMAYQSYSISAKETLGCRFLQDDEKGPDAGICTAAIEKGGTADRQGIVVGMVIYSIHGTPVKGMAFNDVMQLVRSARSTNAYWTIELIHPMNQPAEASIRWATLLTEKGLNEFTNSTGGDKKVSGLRRLSVAVGIKTHEEDNFSPTNYHRSDEVGAGAVRRASISSQGSDGSGSRRGSLTGGTPPASAGRRGSVGSETISSGRRASIASQGSNDGIQASIPPAARRRGSIASQGSNDGIQASIPPAARRRGSITQGAGGPPATQPHRRGSISLQTTPLSPVLDPVAPTSVPTFNSGPQSIGKYRVLGKCTVREGKSGETTKLGEYPKGTILDIVEEAVNANGLAVVRTTTRTGSGALGGWVKIRTAKGKLLLEKLQGVRSGRRMSVATVASDGRTIAPEELIDVTFTGSGALGMLFEEIATFDGRPGKDIAIKKIVGGSIAADILDVEVGLILRNVNTTAVSGHAYTDAMKMIGSAWKGADEMTLTFAKPELVDDSEEEEEEEQVGRPEEAESENVPYKLDLGGKSPGGRTWVDGSAMEEKSAALLVPSLSLDSQQEEAEQPATAMEENLTTSSMPDPDPAVAVAPLEVVTFMEQNGAGEYAVKLCQLLGVTRVEDFLDLEADDYAPLNMKTIPKRRLMKAVAAMSPAGSPEEGVPTLAVAQSAAPAFPEAAAEKPQRPQASAGTKPLVNVYISPFLDKPETTVEIDRIRERMQSLEGQPGQLKCMRADYTGWDIVESFHA